MSYRRSDNSLHDTDEFLNEKLRSDGFEAYPAQPNKYWNPDGRVVWTDGDLYRRSDGHGWARYKEDDH